MFLQFYFHFSFNRVWNYSNFIYIFLQFLFTPNLGAWNFPQVLLLDILICSLKTDLKQIKKRPSNRGKLQLFDAQSNLIPNELNSIFQLDQLAPPHDYSQFRFVHEIVMGVVS